MSSYAADRRDAQRKYERDSAALKKYFTQHGDVAATIALGIVEEFHKGFRKDKITPNAQHQICSVQLFLPYRDVLNAGARNTDAFYAKVLLHDTPEENPSLTREDLKKRFSGISTVDDIVNSSFRLSKIRNGQSLQLARYYENLAHDPEDMLAKLGENHHNARTIYALLPNKQNENLIESQLLVDFSRTVKFPLPLDWLAEIIRVRTQTVINCHEQMAALVQRGRKIPDAFMLARELQFPASRNMSHYAGLVS